MTLELRKDSVTSSYETLSSLKARRSFGVCARCFGFVQSSVSPSAPKRVKTSVIHVVSISSEPEAMGTRIRWIVVEKPRIESGRNNIM